MQMQLHITNRILIECDKKVIQILNNLSGRLYCSTKKKIYIFCKLLHSYYQTDTKRCYQKVMLVLNNPRGRLYCSTMKMSKMTVF